MIEFNRESGLSLAGLCLGYMVFENVTVEKTNVKLETTLATSIEAVKQKFTTTGSLPNDPVVKGVRQLFSSAGIDPTKERPSGEALIRRILNGSGIYRINTLVDANNILSMSFGHPCGVYDLDKISGSITIGVGKEGEYYDGISERKNAANKIVTRDSIGIFGAPTADSARTAITVNTKKALLLIYHPSAAPSIHLDQAMEMAKLIIPNITGGQLTQSGVFSI